MKKYILIAILILVGLTTSCDLERIPGNSIQPENAFKTIGDAENFRVGNYAAYRVVNYNARRQLSDGQTDIVNAVSSFGNRGGSIYLWDDRLGNDSGIASFYAICYSTISDVNFFLESIEFIEPQNAAEEARINNYKGEAYLMRATLFHDLARHFAKAYNPATAATDLGVSLTLKYDPKAKPARATLKQTYDQIQSDLNQAKALLNVEGTPGSVWLTKDFAHAVQARVSLDRQEWNEAIAAADQIIPKYALARTETALRSLWRNDISTEIVVGLFVSRTEGRSASLSYINFSVSSGRFVPDYVASKKVVDAYTATDLRKDVYLTSLPILVSSTIYPGVRLINKYPSNPDFNSNPLVNQYVHKPKLFIISEAYLIKAEAQARGGIGDALATLNILSEARRGGTLSGDALQQVKEERFREMLAEGQRLHDLKRWNEPLNRTGGQAIFSASGLYTENNALTLQKPVTDKMWVWEIPANDLQSNPNMQPNWK